MYHCQCTAKVSLEGWKTSPHKLRFVASAKLAGKSCFLGLEEVNVGSGAVFFPLAFVFSASFPR